MYRSLPNLLTLTRLALAPFVAWLIGTGEFRRAALLIFVAGITDGLDGFLARRFQWGSRLGAYLDPVADKLLLVLSYIALAYQGAVPKWLVWIVLGRDALILAMVATALALTQVRSFPPTIWGKLSTIVQVFAALAIVADRAWLGGPHLPPEHFVIGVTALITLWSGAHYAWTGTREFLAIRSAQ